MAKYEMTRAAARRYIAHNAAQTYPYNQVAAAEEWLVSEGFSVKYGMRKLVDELRKYQDDDPGASFALAGLASAAISELYELREGANDVVSGLWKLGIVAALRREIRELDEIENEQS